MNGALCQSSVFVLDDGAHLAGGLSPGPHNAPVAGRVGHVECEQRQALSARFSQQGLQSGDLRQRHVARQHQRHAVVWQIRQGLLHGMTRAQLRLLACKL